MQIFDSTIRDILSERLDALEKHFNADVIFYYGEIHSTLEKFFRDCIEKLKEDKPEEKQRLVIFLNTPGGSAETVDLKLRNLIRTYNDLLIEYIRKNDYLVFIHSKYLF